LKIGSAVVKGKRVREAGSPFRGIRHEALEESPLSPSFGEIRKHSQSFADAMRNSCLLTKTNAHFLQ
jgi:hypothetical protein